MHLQKIRECGGIAILVDLLRETIEDGDDTQTQLRCVGALLNLSVVDENRAEVRDQGGVEQICRLLTRGETPAIKQYAVGALSNLCADDSIKGLVLEQDAIRDVVGLLVDDPDPTTKSYAASALCTLSSNEECAREMGVQGAVGALHDVCLNGDDLEMVTRATGAFWNLAVVEENRVRMRQEERLIPKLLSLLAQAAESGGDAEMQEVGNNCAMALGILASDEANARIIAESGGLQAMMKFMQLERDNAEALTSVCLALWNLAQRAENRAAIGNNAEWLQEILNVLKCGAVDAMEKAAGCILTLALDRNVAKALISIGALEALMPLLSGIDPSQSEYLDLLRNVIVCFGMFSNDTDNKDRIREAGALGPLVDLLTHPSKDTEIIEKVTGTLLNLSLSQENRILVRQLDGIKPLVDLLDHPNERVQHNAAGALWNLSVDNQNKMLIREFGGLKKLLDKVKREAAFASGQVTKRPQAAQEKVEPTPTQPEAFKPAKKGVVVDSSDDELDDSFDRDVKSTGRGGRAAAQQVRRTGPPSRKTKSTLHSDSDSDVDDEQEKKPATVRRTGPPSRTSVRRVTKLADSDDDDDEQPVDNKKSTAAIATKETGRTTGPPSRRVTSGRKSVLSSDSEDDKSAISSSIKRSSVQKDRVVDHRSSPIHTGNEEQEEKRAEQVDDDSDVLAEFDRFRQENKGFNMMASMNLDKFLLDPKTVESFGRVIEEEEVELTIGASIDLSKPIPYEILENKSRPKLFPKGMNVGSREQYLSDEEFKLYFKMTKAEFAKIPHWKQTRQKRELGLF